MIVPEHEELLLEIRKLLTENPSAYTAVHTCFQLARQTETTAQLFLLRTLALNLRHISGSELPGIARRYGPKGDAVSFESAHKTLLEIAQERGLILSIRPDVVDMDPAKVREELQRLGYDSKAALQAMRKAGLLQANRSGTGLTMTARVEGQVRSVLRFTRHGFTPDDGFPVPIDANLITRAEAETAHREVITAARDRDTLRSEHGTYVDIPPIFVRAALDELGLDSRGMLNAWREYGLIQPSTSPGFSRTSRVKGKNTCVIRMVTNNYQDTE